MATKQGLIKKTDASVTVLNVYDKESLNTALDSLKTKAGV